MANLMMYVDQTLHTGFLTFTTEQSSHRPVVHLPDHILPLTNEEYSNGTISDHEEYMSSPLDEAHARASPGWQPSPQIEPFHQAQPLTFPLLPLSPSPQLEHSNGAQPPMFPTLFPSLVWEDFFDSAYRNHPTRSAPQGARISRRSLVPSGRVSSLRGRNSDRISLRHSDRSRRLRDTKNRLSPLSPFRTRLPLRRQDSRNYPTRAAECFDSRPVLVLLPEAEGWASQHMRRRPGSIPRENTPLQPSDQAAGPDSKLGRDILDAYGASWYSGNEAIDRAETFSLANNEAGPSHLQSNVDVQDSVSPLPPFSGNNILEAARFPADTDVEQPDPRRSPSPDSEILAPPPFRSADDVEGAYFPSFDFLGEDIPTPFHSHSEIDVDEPYSPASPDLAPATVNFLPDWEAEESHRQESNDMLARRRYLAGLDTTLWDQPLAFSRATDRFLSDGPTNIASHYTPPGLAHECASNVALGDTPPHESDDFSIRDSGNIINQHSRPTAAQISRFQHYSTMSHQVQSSKLFGEDSSILQNGCSFMSPFRSVNNLHVEVAGTQIPSSEEQKRQVDQDEINDDESEGTVVGDWVEIDGVWNSIEHSEADSMI